MARLAYGNPRDARVNRGSPVSQMPMTQRIGSAANYQPGGGAQAISSLASAYQSRYDEARQANEQRYQDILGGYGDLYGRAMGAMDQRSQQGLQDINEAYRDERSSMMQGLAERGMYGSSIQDAMKIGLTESQTAARNRFQDERLRERLGYDVGITQGRLGFMERREDEYPDPGMLAQLAQMYGQAGPMGLPPEIMSLFGAMYGGAGGSAATGPRASQVAAPQASGAGAAPGGYTTGRAPQLQMAWNPMLPLGRG